MGFKDCKWRKEIILSFFSVRERGLSATLSSHPERIDSIIGYLCFYK
jgi:hypothetical protein